MKDRPHTRMPHVPANHNPQAGKQNRNTSITTVFQIWVEEQRKREAKLNRDMNSETTDREKEREHSKTTLGQEKHNIES